MYVTYYNPLTVTYEVKYVKMNACTKRKNCHYECHTFSESSSVCVCVELCQHNRLTELHMYFTKSFLYHMYDLRHYKNILILFH